MNGNKAKLMQKYSDDQKKILNQYGGNISDLPADKDHMYHKIQDKISILGKM
jgi:cysteine synthase